MAGEFSRKRRHDLFRAASADEFAALFRRETGLSVGDVVSQYVRPDAVRLVALGGSIPLAMGSAVSDIDLLILADSAGALEPRPPSRSAVAFRTHPQALILSECVAMIDGLEADLQIVSAARVSELLQRVCRGQSTFTQEELVVLSRLAAGWPLTPGGPEPIEGWQLPWRASLRIYCATRDYTFALKELEDARESAGALPPLARHLGRLAAEYGCRAYLASRGQTALGSKWMRLLFSGPDPVAVRPGVPAAMGAALELLFPARATPSPHGCGEYLDDVAAFLTALRAEIERDPAMKVAFRVCPQIYGLGGGDGA